MNHTKGRKRKKIEIKGQSHFNLQLTSIVDMLTILLVFLLQNFSASATNFEAPPELKLPISTSVVEPTDVLKIELTQRTLKLEGKSLSLEADKNDPEFLVELFNSLDSKAKEKMVAKTTGGAQEKATYTLSLHDALPIDRKSVV